MMGVTELEGRGATGWVLYDLANSTYGMGVVALYLPLWIAMQVGEARADSIYTLITATSTGLSLIVAPFLGAMSDRATRRMPFLVASTLICIASTLMLARLGVWATAAFFIVGRMAYLASLQFYIALLPDVSTPETRGRIAGLGISVGYLGDALAIAAGSVVPDDREPLLFGVIAGAYLLFALPAFLLIRERGNPSPRPISLATIRDSTRATVAALRDNPGLARFLVGRFFYMDSINTVVVVMALFVANVAATPGTTDDAVREGYARVFMLLAISFGFVGGVVWGRVTDRIGPRRALGHVLHTWMGVFVANAAIAFLGLPSWTVLLVAPAAGLSMAGVFTADRTFMLRLAPPDRIGEFYGLYGVAGRAAAIVGPLIWGLVFHLAVVRAGSPPLEAQGVGMLALFAMTGVGHAVVRRVSADPGAQAPGQ